MSMRDLVQMRRRSGLRRMKTIVAKGRIDDDMMDRILSRLGRFTDGFKEVIATDSRMQVMLEGDLWGAIKILIEEGCAVETIHVAGDAGSDKVLDVSCEYLADGRITFGNEVAG